jgi:hypothetical protein
MYIYIHKYTHTYLDPGGAGSNILDCISEGSAP